VQDYPRNPAEFARSLIPHAERLRGQIAWKQTTFSVKLADPGATGGRLTLFYLTKDGKLAGHDWRTIEEWRRRCGKRT